jgi:hypothetical protein
MSDIFIWDLWRTHKGNILLLCSKLEIYLLYDKFLRIYVKFLLKHLYKPFFEGNHKGKIFWGSQYR